MTTTAQVRLSEPNAEEVLVKIVCSSICRSDVKTAMNKVQPHTSPDVETAC